MTANLHITVKQAAALMNVSERMVYEARRLYRTGRADLIEQVKAGTLSLHRALILAGVKQPKIKTSFDVLKFAWISASNAERQSFFDWLDGGAS